MLNKYLPIGSICVLKNANRKVMITGFCIKGTETGDKVFDYVGCFYPEGILSLNKNILFDHEQIEKVVCVGFINEEEKSFKAKVNDITDNKPNSSIFDESVYDMNTPVATIEPAN